MECRLRLRLPASQARDWMAMPPTLRAHVFTSVLNAATTGLDLQRLVIAERELHRVGVSLNQALARAHRHHNAVDADSINAAVTLIESLRGGQA